MASSVAGPSLTARGHLWVAVLMQHSGDTPSTPSSYLSPLQDFIHRSRLSDGGAETRHARKWLLGGHCVPWGSKATARASFCNLLVAVRARSSPQDHRQLSDACQRPSQRAEVSEHRKKSPLHVQRQAELLHYLYLPPAQRRRPVAARNELIISSWRRSK